MGSTNEKTIKVINQAGPGGAIAVVAYIGAAIYFIEKTGGGFFDVLLALLQALVWPAYLVFHILKTLGV